MTLHGGEVYDVSAVVFFDGGHWTTAAVYDGRVTLFDDHRVVRLGSLDDAMGLHGDVRQVIYRSRFMAAVHPVEPYNGRDPARAPDGTPLPNWWAPGAARVLWACRQTPMMPAPSAAAQLWAAARANGQFPAPVRIPMLTPLPVPLPAQAVPTPAAPAVPAPAVNRRDESSDSEDDAEDPAPAEVAADWTQDEDDILRFAFASSASWADCAVPGRGVNAVKRRARRLGLVSGSGGVAQLAGGERVDLYVNEAGALVLPVPHDAVAVTFNEHLRILDPQDLAECAQGLVSVTLVASLTEVKQYSFHGCSALRHVVFNAGFAPTRLGYGVLADILIMLVKDRTRAEFSGEAVALVEVRSAQLLKCLSCPRQPWAALMRLNRHMDGGRVRNPLTAWTEEQYQQALLAWPGISQFLAEAAVRLPEEPRLPRSPRNRRQPDEERVDGLAALTPAQTAVFNGDASVLDPTRPLQNPTAVFDGAVMRDTRDVLEQLLERFPQHGTIACERMAFRGRYLDVLRDNLTQARARAIFMMAIRGGDRAAVELVRDVAAWEELPVELRLGTLFWDQADLLEPLDIALDDAVADACLRFDAVRCASAFPLAQDWLQRAAELGAVKVIYSWVVAGDVTPDDALAAGVAAQNVAVVLVSLAAGATPVAPPSLPAGEIRTLIEDFAAARTAPSSLVAEFQDVSVREDNRRLHVGFEWAPEARGILANMIRDGLLNDLMHSRVFFCDDVMVGGIAFVGMVGQTGDAFEAVINGRQTRVKTEAALLGLMAQIRLRGVAGPVTIVRDDRFIFSDSFLALALANGFTFRFLPPNSNSLNYVVEAMLQAAGDAARRAGEGAPRARIITEFSATMNSGNFARLFHGVHDVLEAMCLCRGATTIPMLQGRLVWGDSLRFRLVPQRHLTLEEVGNIWLLRTMTVRVRDIAAIIRIRKQSVRAVLAQGESRIAEIAPDFAGAVVHGVAPLPEGGHAWFFSVNGRNFDWMVTSELEHFPHVARAAFIFMMREPGRIVARCGENAIVAVPPGTGTFEIEIPIQRLRAARVWPAGPRRPGARPERPGPRVVRPEHIDQADLDAWILGLTPGQVDPLVMAPVAQVVAPLPNVAYALGANGAEFTLDPQQAPTVIELDETGFATINLRGTPLPAPIRWLGAEYLMNLPGHAEWERAGRRQMNELLLLVREAGETWPTHRGRRNVTCAMLVDSYFGIHGDRGTICAATGVAFENVDRYVRRAIAMGVTPGPNLDEDIQPAWLLVRRELATWFVQNFQFARWARNMALIDRLAVTAWAGHPENFMMAAQVYVERRIGGRPRRVVSRDAIGVRLRGLRAAIVVAPGAGRVALANDVIERALILAERNGIPIL
jgi:hypothetical protein